MHSTRKAQDYQLRFTFVLYFVLRLCWILFNNYELSLELRICRRSLLIGNWSQMDSCRGILDNCFRLPITVCTIATK